MVRITGISRKVAGSEPLKFLTLIIDAFILLSSVGDDLRMCFEGKSSSTLTSCSSTLVILVSWTGVFLFVAILLFVVKLYFWWRVKRRCGICAKHKGVCEYHECCSCKETAGENKCICCECPTQGGKCCCYTCPVTKELCCAHDGCTTDGNEQNELTTRAGTNDNRSIKRKCKCCKKERESGDEFSFKFLCCKRQQCTDDYSCQKSCNKIRCTCTCLYWLQNVKSCTLLCCSCTYEKKRWPCVEKTAESCDCPSRKEKCHKCIKCCAYIFYDVVTIFMGAFFLIGDNLSDDICVFYGCGNFDVNTSTCELLKDKPNDMNLTYANCTNLYAKTCRRTAVAFLGVSTILNLFLLYLNFKSIYDKGFPSIGTKHTLWIKTFGLLSLVIIFDQTITGLYQSVFRLTRNETNICGDLLSVHLSAGFTYGISVCVWTGILIIHCCTLCPKKNTAKCGLIFLLVTLWLVYVFYIFADTPWPWECFDTNSMYNKIIGIAVRLFLVAVSLLLLLFLLGAYILIVCIPSLHVQRKVELALVNSGVAEYIRKLPRWKSIPTEENECLLFASEFEEKITSASYKISFSKDYGWYSVLCCKENGLDGTFQPRKKQSRDIQLEELQSDENQPGDAAVENQPGGVPTMENRLEEVPAVENQRGEVPAVENQRGELPAVENQRGEVPAVENQHGEVPAVKNQRGEVPAVKNQRGEVPAVENQRGEVPAVENQCGEVPAVENQRGEVPAVENQRGEVSAVENQDGEVPAVENQHGELPAVENQHGKVPAVENRRGEVPAVENQPEEVRYQVDQTQRKKRKSYQAIMKNLHPDDPLANQISPGSIVFGTSNGNDHEIKFIKMTREEKVINDQASAENEAQS